MARRDIRRKIAGNEKENTAVKTIPKASERVMEKKKMVVRKAKQATERVRKEFKKDRGWFRGPFKGGRL